MTDNFKLIKEFIQSQFGGQFDSFTNVFYMIEIIRRHKDNNNFKDHKFKTYYIRTIEDLDKYEDEIKTVCDIFNMRAYISVNHKSMKHITLNTIAEYANRVAHDNFDKPYSLFDSCATKYVEHSEQLWIVDVDKEDIDINNISIDDLVDNYIKVIESCEPKNKIVAVIPTKSGKHIITHKFNISEFMKRVNNSKQIDDFVKKNNFTLLYENIK